MTNVSEETETLLDAIGLYVSTTARAGQSFFFFLREKDSGCCPFGLSYVQSMNIFLKITTSIRTSTATQQPIATYFRNGIEIAAILMIIEAINKKAITFPIFAIPFDLRNACYSRQKDSGLLSLAFRFFPT